jgi:hypothetical protein
LLANFYAVVGNPPEVVGAMNAMAGALLEEGATVEQVSIALRTCRRVKFPVRLPHILENLPGHGVDDGRPEPENAWAMCPKSEEASVVWTAEMASAFEGARRLLLEGDAIAARMAFREAYISEVARARSEGRPIRWSASLGYDKADRVAVLTDAVAKHRLKSEHALELAGSQFEELRMALPVETSQLHLKGETRREIELPVPGLPGILKALVDAKLMPGIAEHPAKAGTRRRSLEEQLAHIRMLETNGTLTTEKASKLADTIKGEADDRCGRSTSKAL